MYKLKDRFTTRDGSIVPDGRPWSITAQQAAKYGPVMPPDKGCATCIIVRLEGGPSKDVFFETTAGYHESHPIDGQGWAHSSMFNPGSGYNAVSGRGSWSVQAEGAPSEVVDNIGLPNGEHVSTWVVLSWEEGGEEVEEGPTPVEPPVGEPSHVQVYIDGVLVYDNQAAG